MDLQGKVYYAQLDTLAATHSVGVAQTLSVVSHAWLPVWGFNSQPLQFVHRSLLSVGMAVEGGRAWTPGPQLVTSGGQCCWWRLLWGRDKERKRLPLGVSDLINHTNFSEH